MTIDHHDGGPVQVQRPPVVAQPGPERYDLPRGGLGARRALGNRARNTSYFGMTRTTCVWVNITSLTSTAHGSGCGATEGRRPVPSNQPSSAGRSNGDVAARIARHQERSVRCVAGTLDDHPTASWHRVSSRARPRSLRRRGAARGGAASRFRHHHLAAEVADLFAALVEARVSTVTTPRSGLLDDSFLSSTFVSA